MVNAFFRRFIVLVFFFCLHGTSSVHAQDRLDELEQRLKVLQEDHGEEIDELQAQIDELQEEVDGLESSTPSTWDQVTESFSALNPSITIFGNFIGRLDDKKVFNEEGDRIDDRFLLRETELDFRAAISPFADGVVTVAIESEAPGEFETVVEEGYLVLKKIPGLEKTPLGLTVTAGRFRSVFGRVNRLHTHDLPWTTRPPSLQTFLGEEGFVREGVSGDMFLPTPGDDNSLKFTLQVVNGGGLPVADQNRSNDLAFVGRLGWFFDLSSEQTLEIGASTYQGKYDQEGSLDTRLWGLDFNYQWRPQGGGSGRSHLFGGELYYASIDQAGGSPRSHPFGGFVWAQVQLNSNLYLGGRADYTETLLDDQIEQQNYAIYLSHYTTEFLRLRVGYERGIGDIKALDNLDSFFVEANFVFGSHPVHPYWANL